MTEKLTIGGLVGVVIGFIFVVLGFKEKAIADASSAQPEMVTLQTVIARGVDGNPNIILTGFSLCDNFVFQTKNGVWTGAWIPIVPSDAPQPQRGGRPAAFQALIFTINARNEADLFQRCGQPQVRALITNKIVNLGSEQRRLLKESYPAADLDRCLIIQEGREPAGPTKLILTLGGGTLATVIGLGLLGIAGYRWTASRNTTPLRKRRRPRDDDEEEEEEDERPRGAKRRQRDDDADDDDRPRRSRRRVQDEDEVEEDRPRRPRRRDDEDEEPPRRRRPRGD